MYLNTHLKPFYIFPFRQLDRQVRYRSSYRQCYKTGHYFKWKQQQHKCLVNTRLIYLKMQWCDSQTTYVKVVKTICWQPSEQYYLCQTYWGYWINRSLLPLLCVQLLIFKYNCTEVLKTNIPCNIANNIFFTLATKLLHIGVNVKLIVLRAYCITFIDFCALK